MNHEQAAREWDLVISSKKGLFSLNLGEIWRYRDLLLLFVKRDFVAQYKQTVFGPLWHFISPIFTTLTYTVIFSNVAGLSTDGTPGVVFYMSGVTIWNFFSQTLTSTGYTFLSNAGIFGKVYFPRLVTPLATLLSKFIQFAIQLSLLLCFVAYYKWNGMLPEMNWVNLVLIPLIAILVGMMALGLGIILSSMTTKYRDLNVLVSFGMNLLMYASPVIYPISSVPDNYKVFLKWNPVTPLIESFRYVVTGTGTFSATSLGYSFAATALFILAGMLVFSRVERTFMDTV